MRQNFKDMKSDADILQVSESGAMYSDDFIHKEETYKVIGACYEVHNYLGRGFAESVYKEALAYEFRLRDIGYEMEKKFSITYKDIVLSKRYICDFIVFDKIILEIKAQEGFAAANYSQTLNYLAASKNRLALLINFGEESLKIKRIIL
jgi:GxxExxY protein